MSHPGKLKLEGIKWVSKPSKRQFETCRKQVIEWDVEQGKVKKGKWGKASPPKRIKVSIAEEKQFQKISSKQAKIHYYKTDPLFHLIGEANET